MAPGAWAAAGNEIGSRRGDWGLDEQAGLHAAGLVVRQRRRDGRGARGQRYARQWLGRFARGLTLTGAIVLVVPSAAFASSGWSAPSPVDPAFLASSVPCASSSFCVAVDDEGNAATYNGSSWSAGP